MPPAPPTTSKAPLPGLRAVTTPSTPRALMPGRGALLRVDVSLERVWHERCKRPPTAWRLVATRSRNKSCQSAEVSGDAI